MPDPGLPLPLRRIGAPSGPTIPQLVDCGVLAVIYPLDAILLRIQNSDVAVQDPDTRIGVAAPPCKPTLLDSPPATD